MTRYRDEEPDAEGWSRWVQPIEQGYKMACCDCGLVHLMNFRIEDDRAQFQVKRAARSTAQVRRYRKAKA